MKKNVLKYTIRVNKKYNEIEIFIRDWPNYMCAFTCISKDGHGVAMDSYYSHYTRPANDKEMSKADSQVINNFLALYGNDYKLKYLKRLPR